MRGTEPTLAVADIALTHPAARLVYTPEAIRSMVIAELHRQTSMQIIEASRFDSVMSEHNLEWSDLVDDQDNRGNIQSKLNNDYFLVVDVSMYGEHLEYKSSAFSKKRRQISSVVLNVQLLDARSNEVRKVARAEAQKSLDVTKSMAGLGPSKGTNPRLAVDVFEIAVRKAVAKLQLAPAAP